MNSDSRIEYEEIRHTSEREEDWPERKVPSNKKPVARRRWCRGGKVGGHFFYTPQPGSLRMKGWQLGSVESCFASWVHSYSITDGKTFSSDESVTGWYISSSFDDRKVGLLLPFTFFHSFNLLRMAHLNEIVEPLIGDDSTERPRVTWLVHSMSWASL